MPDIAKAYVHIIPSAKDMKKNLTSIMGKDADAAGRSGGEKMGGGIAGGIKSALVKLGIGAVIGKTIKDSLDEGGALQQSLGGVETLFGSKFANIEEYAQGMGLSMEKAAQTWETYSEREKTVIANADNAYKTAGLSANEYMETVTGFAAALNASLGENAWASANYADMAITDMADNANKFGTQMDSIQTAYAGFSKQNFTMLDNLKLGYGGTKTEMQRLLRDAEKLEGLKVGSYDENNFSDVVSAIHTIQENLGVTGTTAKEAATTFQGSMASMKSAWKNVLGNMMTGREELKGSVIALGESIGTFISGNLVPALWNIVQAVPELFITAFDTFAPKIVTGAGDLLTKASDGIKGKIPEFATMAMNAISSFAKSIADNFPTMVSKGAELLKSVAQGIADSLPTIGSKAVEIIGNLAAGFVESLPTIIKSGVEIVTALGVGLYQALPEVYQKMKDAGAEIWEKLKETDWIQLGKDVFEEIKNGLAEALPNVLSVAIDLKDQITEKAKELWSNVRAKGQEYIPIAVSYAKNKFEEMKNSVKAKFESLGERISSTWNTIKANVQLKVMAVKNTITSKIQEAKDRAVSIFQNAVQPIKDTWQSIKDSISGMIEQIKGLFNFEWSFPKPKMPKITVDGGEAPWGILGKGRAPEFSVAWKKTAMENAQILDGAQIFGAMNGKLLGGGEAGREVISGESHLMDLIGQTVSGVTNREVKEIAALMRTFVGSFYDNLVRALKTLGIKFDERELARVVQKYA